MDFTNSDYEEDDLKLEAMQKIFENLNPKQTEAVKCLEGPLLIMAGAGSGKTRVLTCRIANLLAHGVSPWNILAITFTNKAANEMKARAEKMIGDAAKSVWLSTFHSFCARILQFEVKSLRNYKSNFVIYSPTDCRVVIRDCVNELKLDSDIFDDNLVLGRISKAKNLLMTSKDYKQAVFTSNNKNEFDLKVSVIYELYEKKLQSLNAMDFDDLLLVAVQLFRENKDILDKYQEKFRYILVDEYQDTNEAQYMLMRLLASKYENVCVVGDADQSIYGWRGADMRNILNFENDYPNATVIKLEQNYRSTKKILDAANAVIQHNVYRKPKNLWTENTNGEEIIVFEALTEYFEAKKVAQEIIELKNEGFEYNDIALLYRINALSRTFEEAFMQAGIPYVIIGGLKFYDRLEIKNILAYLRLIYNLQDDMSLRRIINVPKRGIGTVALNKLQEFAASHEVSIFEVISNDWLLNQVEVYPRIKQNMRDFAALILNCRELQKNITVDELIEYVLKESRYLLELKTDAKPEEEARIENLGEFVNVAHEFVNTHKDDCGLDAFLNHISLISDLDVVNEEENRVSLMTVHSAKGLEFPVVFINGFEEGLFPHSRSLKDGEQLEEERRACYVAITRAEQKLYITYALNRHYFGKSKKSFNSRFLEEIPIEFLDYYVQRNSSRIGMPVFEHIISQKNNLEDIKPVKKVAQKVQEKAKIISINAQKAKNKEQANKNLLREWKIGDIVQHKKWGKGKVIDIKGSSTEKALIVKFFDEDIGTKNLLLMYAPITKVIK